MAIVPLQEISCLTNLEYLHLFDISGSEPVNFELLGVEHMKKLSTLKLAANSSVSLPEDFYSYILQVRHLSLTSFNLPKMASLSMLANLKQLILFEVGNINHDDLFELPNLEVLKITFDNNEAVAANLKFKPTLAEKCKKLRELVLASCTFSPESCDAIAKLPNLEYLSVPQSRLLEMRYLYAFAAMPSLRTLNLSYNINAPWSITWDSGFFQQIVAKAKVLRTVYLIGFSQYDSRKSQNDSVEFVFSR